MLYYPREEDLIHKSKDDLLTAGPLISLTGNVHSLWRKKFDLWTIMATVETYLGIQEGRLYTPIPIAQGFWMEYHFFWDCRNSRLTAANLSPGSFKFTRRTSCDVYMWLQQIAHTQVVTAEAKVVGDTWVGGCAHRSSPGWYWWLQHGSIWKLRTFKNMSWEKVYINVD